jgi:D-glycerate 3-kinase
LREGESLAAMTDGMSPAPNPSPALRGEGDVTQIPTIIYDVIQQQRALHSDRPVLIGVAGAQGSGKTTACQLLEMANRPRFAHFSLDDVYWSKDERADLADLIHPLFVTRGPPGTHDLDLAIGTIAALKAAKAESATGLPRFDKLRDEPAEKAEWPVFRGKPEAILIDGWCIGALAPESTRPINALEAIDSDGKWRESQAIFLREDYAPFFALFDAIVYLRPPNWEIVRSWRGQQEEQLLGRAMNAEESAKLDRFMMHYERITRSMMAGGHVADVVVEMDEARGVIDMGGEPTIK